MKKLLALSLMGFLIPVLMALTLEPDDPGEPIRPPTPINGHPFDDKTLRGVILDLADDIWLNIHSDEDIFIGIKSIAKNGGVTPERMTKMLESIVREGLRDMKKETKGSDEYSFAAAKLDEPVLMLRIFNGPNTLALLEECALSKDDRGVVEALKTYIHIAGAVEALPLILKTFTDELLAKNGKGMNPVRNGVFKELQNAAIKLKNEGKNEDANKVYTALIAFAYLEFEPNTARQLDQILCSDLPDYSTSIEREQSIEKFLGMGLNTDYFKNIKSEIGKVQAGKRRDYSKMPLVKNPPAETKTILLTP